MSISGEINKTVDRTTENILELYKFLVKKKKLNSVPLIAEILIETKSDR